MSEDHKDITPRADLLREAERLITGDRNETYGTPTQNFTNIADLWNIQFRHLLADGKQFTPADVALALIQVKLARTIAQPKRDNWTDIAGYAACGYETTVKEEPAAITGVVPPSIMVTTTDPDKYITFNDTTTGTVTNFFYTQPTSPPSDDNPDDEPPAAAVPAAPF